MGDWADDKAQEIIDKTWMLAPDNGKRAIAMALREAVEAFAGPLNRLITAQGRDILAKQRTIDMLQRKVENPLVMMKDGVVTPVPSQTFYGYISTCQNCGQQHIAPEPSCYCPRCVGTIVKVTP